MAALVKYADSDSTKDPESDDEKPGKGKKSGSAKGQQHNPAGHRNSGKRKADNSLDFVANTNTQDNGQRRKGKPPKLSAKPALSKTWDEGGAGKPPLERLLYYAGVQEF